MNNITIDKNLMRRVVRAIEKAITDDVPQYLNDNYKETNNAVIHLRGDCINNNLRNLVAGGNIELIPFKRYSWQGRILVDRKEKITYTVTTQKTLNSIPRKQRNSPHFLQTMLGVENGNYEATVKQIGLVDFYPFEEEDLKLDYYSIVQGLIDHTEGYCHYVIAYESNGNELTDVRLLFLDKEFDMIDTVSLNEYRSPDFARLTDTEPAIDHHSDGIEKEAEDDETIKKELRPKLREVTKQF